MPNRLFATIVAAIFLLSAAPAVLGDKGQDAADRQQAVEHSREVHRMKEHTREQEWQMRNQAAEDRAKVKKHADEAKEEDRDEDTDEDTDVIAEEEEGFGNDLDDK